MIVDATTTGAVSPGPEATKVGPAPCPEVRDGVVTADGSNEGVPFGIDRCHLSGVVVKGRAAGAAVPEIGHGVVAEALLIDGMGAEMLSIHSSADGFVTWTLER